LASSNLSNARFILKFNFMIKTFLGKVDDRRGRVFKQRIANEKLQKLGHFLKKKNCYLQNGLAFIVSEVHFSLETFHLKTGLK
jgi:hypothetical protein